MTVTTGDSVTACFSTPPHTPAGHKEGQTRDFCWSTANVPHVQGRRCVCSISGWELTFHGEARKKKKKDRLNNH